MLNATQRGIDIFCYYCIFGFVNLEVMDAGKNDVNALKFEAVSKGVWINYSLAHIIYVSNIYLCQ